MQRMSSNQHRYREKNKLQTSRLLVGFHREMLRLFLTSTKTVDLNSDSEVGYRSYFCSLVQYECE
jgi:hypothetical protein